MPEQAAAWRVTECKYPGLMWQRYAEALGYENLVSWFGENWPPPERRPLEEVFVVRDANKSPRVFDPNDHPAAWISLSVDQFDPEVVHMSRGVWPDQHGYGLGRFMRTWAENWCKERRIKTMLIWISDSNKQHLDKVKADNYWSLSALSFDPLCFAFRHEITE
jgi:GNAT superfamily N-acetyltransferase